ncbi:GIY-YIG nuclease family protein [bacterium]|nr:GIY-YIG nuclease family protein [bacterium]MBO5447219.1 GIY-YIG nuclease family protein [bacterium]
MNEKQYYVYIITNKYNTTIYVGVTNNLARRIYEHKNKLVEGFSSKYNLNKLIYFECTENVESAIIREKQIKNYSRAKKELLIEKMNPNREDLYESIL